MLSVMLLFFQSTYCLGDYRLIWLFSPVPRKSHYPIITVLENYQPNESPRIFLGVVRCPRSQLTRAKCHNQKNDRVRPWEGGRELSIWELEWEGERSLFAKFKSFLYTLPFCLHNNCSCFMLNHLQKFYLNHPQGWNKWFLAIGNYKMTWFWTDFIALVLVERFDMIWCGHPVFVVLTQFAFGVFDVAPLPLGWSEIIAGKRAHIWSGLAFGLGHRFKEEPGNATDVDSC